MSVARRSEHDTWVSVDAVVGCPARCGYCFVQKHELTGTRPRVVQSAEAAVEDLARYLQEDAGLGGEETPPLRVACVGNHTDLFMTEEGRRFAVEYVQKHCVRLPRVPIVFITKAVLGRDALEEIDGVGHPVIVFVSQSFFAWYRRGRAAVEQGVADPEQTARNLERMRACRHVKGLHFWRPLTDLNLPSEEEARRQARLMKAAGAMASVAVGLKHGEYLRRRFADPGHPLREAVKAERDEYTPVGEEFPPRLREWALQAGRAEGHPVYLNSSCAVSLALGVPEFLQTWRAPIAEARCKPVCCPSEQRARCGGQKAKEPGEKQIVAICEHLMIPRSAAQWRAEAGALWIQARVDQSTQCRIAHASGIRIQVAAMEARQEWIGTLGGIGGNMEQQGLEVELRTEEGGPELSRLIRRMTRITGMVSPVGPAGDGRYEVFSRFLHVRRVVCVAAMLAARVQKGGGKIREVRVRQLAWMHDLHRWPFAHNGEKDRYCQVEELPGFFEREGVELDAEDLGDLLAIHRKDREALSLEGRIVLTADQAVGPIEDLMFAVAALRLKPERISGEALERIGLPLREGAFVERLVELRRRFDPGPTQDIQGFIAAFDRIVTAHAFAFVERHCADWNGFTLGPALSEHLRYWRGTVLANQVFPIVNEQVAHGAFVREHIIEPTIREAGADYRRVLGTMDDATAIELALSRGFIEEEQLPQVYPNLEWWRGSGG